VSAADLRLCQPFARYPGWLLNVLVISATEKVKAGAAPLGAMGVHMTDFKSGVRVTVPSPSFNSFTEAEALGGGAMRVTGQGCELPGGELKGRRMGFRCGCGFIYSLLLFSIPIYVRDLSLYRNSPPNVSPLSFS
jgi:hypothetical protein